MAAVKLSSSTPSETKSDSRQSGNPFKIDNGQNAPSYLEVTSPSHLTRLRSSVGNIIEVIQQMVPGIQPRIDQDIQKGHKALEEVEHDFVQMNKEMERFRRLDVRQAKLSYRQVVNVWTKEIICPAMGMKWEDLHPKLRKGATDPEILAKLKRVLKDRGISWDEYTECRSFHQDVSEVVAHGKFNDLEDAHDLLERIPSGAQGLLQKVLKHVMDAGLGDLVFDNPPLTQNPRPTKQSRHK